MRFQCILGRITDSVNCSRKFVCLWVKPIFLLRHLMQTIARLLLLRTKLSESRLELSSISCISRILISLNLPLSLFRRLFIQALPRIKRFLLPLTLIPLRLEEIGGEPHFNFQFGLSNHFLLFSQPKY